MYTEVHGGVMDKQSAVSQRRENRVPVTVVGEADSRTASRMRCIFSGMSKRAQANFRWICRLILRIGAPLPRNPPII